MHETNAGTRYGRFLARLLGLYIGIFVAGGAIVIVGATIWSHPYLSAAFAAGAVAMTLVGFALHLFRDDLRSVIGDAIHSFEAMLGSSLAHH